MTQELIKLIEEDLRQVAETEITKFRDRYSECQVVNSIYLNEQISIGVYDIQIHGLSCDHYLNLYIAGDRIYEFPEFRCYITYEDKEADFKRHLAHIVLLYTPTNRCYLKAEIHYHEPREVAEHIVKAAAAAEEGNHED
jgi:hypothetical protein